MTQISSGLSQVTFAKPLYIALRTERSGPVIAKAPVTRADLAEVISEAWREVCLRRGFPAVALAETAMRLVPNVHGQDDTGRCHGYALEVATPNGQCSRCSFSIYSLSHVARRMAQPLQAAGILKGGQHYFYEIIADQTPATESAESPLSVMSVTVKNLPLTYHCVDLEMLRAQARPVAPNAEEDFPVFYTATALSKAEACARQGGSQTPVVESGGVLLGALVVSQRGEFGAVITDVLEVQDAEQTLISLSYTSKSWQRIQIIIKARQSAHPERAERLVGQCHGHSFLPNDGKSCSECEKRPSCTLTSAFASPEDHLWHQAVFARQPWCLCHIFGLSARAEPVDKLFGLKDGRLQARGYYVLPEFDLEPAPLSQKNNST